MDIIRLQIDVTKIDKKKLYKGEKGTYLDCALIPTQNNQYGNDYMIVEKTTDEERKAGTKGTILGNAKIYRPNKPTPDATPAPSPQVISSDIPDDLPF